MRWALPMTKVTAMVSPSARPRPSMTAADDADARVGDDHPAHHLPARAADAVSRLFQHRRDGVEHLAGDRGDEGKHHDGEDEPGGQHADAIRRPGEELIEHRNFAKGVDQHRLHIGLKEGGEHEQAPDAVDDARDAGEQLNGDADRPAQALGADLGQEDGNAEADGNADQHGDEGSQERAVDRRQGAEFLGDRVPALRSKEVEAEGAPSGKRAMHERQHDARENHQHGDG